MFQASFPASWQCLRWHLRSPSLSGRSSRNRIGSGLSRALCLRRRNSIPPPAVRSAPARPEGRFWGRINPFARKKWVKKQIDPINDRLTELDEVNAKNARDIRTWTPGAGRHPEGAVLGRTANQAATAANHQAQNASNTAQKASTHVDQINTTVNGLDQYHQVTDFEIKFRGGSPALTTNPKRSSIGWPPA